MVGSPTDLSFTKDKNMGARIATFTTNAGYPKLFKFTKHSMRAGHVSTVVLLGLAEPEGLANMADHWVLLAIRGGWGDTASRAQLGYISDIAKRCIDSSVCLLGTRRYGGDPGPAQP